MNVEYYRRMSVKQDKLKYLRCFQLPAKNFLGRGHHERWRHNSLHGSEKFWQFLLHSSTAALAQDTMMQSSL